ncbi:MAG: hypothetical protein ACXIVE_18355, partial [Salinarimonas sp.]
MEGHFKVTFFRGDAMTLHRSANAPVKLSRMLKSATQTLHDVTEQRFLALSGAGGNGLLPNL